MGERPIIFSAPMVRAILDGRKTQTRRVIKPQPVEIPEQRQGNLIIEASLMYDRGRRAARIREKKGLAPKAGVGVNLLSHPSTPGRYCPFGVPGDRLWVREGWRIHGWGDDEPRFGIEYRADGSVLDCFVPEEIDPGGEKFTDLWIECCDEANASGFLPDDSGNYYWETGEAPTRWRPSIHMPKWAARIWLEIEKVRVERLQGISEEDVWEEGVDVHLCSDLSDGMPCSCGGVPVPAQVDFALEWDSIHAKKPENQWDANPWVWAVSFEVEARK